MPSQLDGLSVHEVSGVDAAANKRKFLLRKSATPTQPKGAPTMSKVTDQFKAMAKSLGFTLTPNASPTLEAICCSLSDSVDGVIGAGDDVAKADATNAFLEQVTVALESPDFQDVDKAGKTSAKRMKQLKAMRDSLNKMLDDDEDDTQKSKTEKDGQESSMTTGMDKDDTGRVNAAKKKPGEDDEDNPTTPTKKEANVAKSDEIVALEKSMALQSEELKKAQQEIAKERELRQDAEFLAKARDIGPVPGSTFEETANLMKSMAGTPNAAVIEKQLRASAELAKSNELLKEKGSNGGGTGTNGSPAAAFIAKSAEIAKRDNIGAADSMAKAAKEHPEMYSAYVNNQRKPS